MKKKNNNEKENKLTLQMDFLRRSLRACVCVYLMLGEPRGAPFFRNCIIYMGQPLEQ